MQKETNTNLEDHNHARRSPSISKTRSLLSTTCRQTSV